MLENEQLAIHERQNSHQQAEMQVVHDKNQLLMTKDEERMKKYRIFLKPYTLVVTCHDFINQMKREEIGVENWKVVELQSKGITMMKNKQAGSSTSANDNEMGDEAILTSQDKSNDNHLDTGDTMNVGIYRSNLNLSNTYAELDNPSPLQSKGGYDNMESHVLTDMNAAPVDLSMVEYDKTVPSHSDDQHYLVDLELGDDCAATLLHFTEVTAAERMLQLPIKDVRGNFCKVGIECVICLVEYEVGDEVIWSTRQSCPHAFHAECILQWLGKGKKRCPICRHLFVPGQRIDDKDIIEHDQRDLINGEC